MEFFCNFALSELFLAKGHVPTFPQHKNMVDMKNSQKYGTGSVNIYVSPAGGDDSRVTWFCCADRGARLFEKQYPLSDGMTYNSYVIEDEKLVVVDTVDHSVEGSWREALDAFLAERGGRKPDYLIVQHLEPDHSAAVEDIMASYPGCKLVCSVKASAMLGQFARGIDSGRVVSVKEGEGIDIGSRKLRFIMAPMVHWPEVMVTYDPLTGILFSADAFGTFGVSLAADVALSVKGSSDLEAEWGDEARRYYINICGKYGAQVQSLLKKVGTLDLRYLCPLHGPVIDICGYDAFRLYDIWSRYEAEYPMKTLVLAASLHGNTVEAACRFVEMMAVRGLPAEMLDLAETDGSEAVSRAFACGSVVFMSSTYDASLVPSMRGVLSRLKSKNWQRRLAAIVENGSWAPIAGKLIAKELEEMKDIEVVGPMVTIRTRLDDASENALESLSKNLAEAISLRYAPVSGDES